MGVAKTAEFEDDFDDFDGDEDFAFLEDGDQGPRVKRHKLAWRSVEDYLDDKRLKEQLSDVFEDDWY